MSRLICLVAFLSLAAFSRANTFVWEVSVPISETWQIGATRVVPDGAGGGVLFIQVTNEPVYRVVWFDSAGHILQTNDVKNAAYVGALRVTPRAIALHADNGGLSRIIEMAKGKEPFDAYLWAAHPGYGPEQAVSDLPAAPDKRGYFVTKVGTQDLILSRFRWFMK